MSLGSIPRVESPLIEKTGTPPNDQLSSWQAAVSIWIESPSQTYVSNIRIGVVGNWLIVATILVSAD
jgi:hypothetical protein